MFKSLPTSNKSEQNKTNSSLLCPSSSPPPHHQASSKGPIYSLSLLPKLPLTPQPSTIWLLSYHSTETALARGTLLELKRLEMLCRNRQASVVGHCILRAWCTGGTEYTIIVLAGAFTPMTTRKLSPPPPPTRFL